MFIPTQRLTLIFVLFFVLSTYSLFSQQILFEDTFEDLLKPAWTTNPGPFGLVELQNGVGLDNSRGMAIGNASDDGFSTNALDLHIDLLGETEVELSFWIRSNYEETQDADGIYFSDDGGQTFHKALDLKPGEWCNNTWGQLPPLDVDDIADQLNLQLNSSFVIRFQQRGQEGFYFDGDGFYIDNVSVIAREAVHQTLPFEDGFEGGFLGEAWSQGYAERSSNDANTSPGTLVAVQNGAGRPNGSSDLGVVLGRTCDRGDQFTTAALDLHLDLSQETDVEMSFWIAGNYEETQADEGLFFSDDGGKSFQKALDFKPGQWCNNTWGQYPPIDVDEIANKIGLTLTDQFIVRFQQRGQEGFYFDGDGIYLDDIAVYVPTREYADIPFEDDFNAGFFSNAWKWSFADNSSSNNDVNGPNAYVGVSVETGINNSPGAFIGSRCNLETGLLKNSALDLQLNLEQEKDVQLSFWIRNIFENTQEDDGLFFSNDGGETFYKAFDFNPSDWCTDDWGRFSNLDVDELAAQIEIAPGVFGLEFTNTFVIRFQQRGQVHFSSGDGFYLDDVVVTRPTKTFASLPFTEDFESGRLDNIWASHEGEGTATQVDFRSPDFVSDIIPRNGENASNGLLLSLRCESQIPVPGGVDLRINASNTANITMTFSLLNIFELPMEGGLFLSDDGGSNFVKISDFKVEPEAFSYFQDTIHISSLAQVNGLNPLSDQMVLRFQQIAPDFLFLDNISIEGDPVTSIDNNSLNDEISVFPNPVSDWLHINYLSSNDLPKTIDYQLTGMNGSVSSPLSGKMPASGEIQVSNLPPGMYVLTLFLTDGRTYRKKIIKH
jgi:hypothetical protein